MDTVLKKKANMCLMVYYMLSVLVLFKLHIILFLYLERLFFQHLHISGRWEIIVMEDREQNRKSKHGCF